MDLGKMIICSCQKPPLMLRTAFRSVSCSLLLPSLISLSKISKRKICRAFPAFSPLSAVVEHIAWGARPSTLSCSPARRVGGVRCVLTTRFRFAKSTPSINCLALMFRLVCYRAAGSLISSGAHQSIDHHINPVIITRSLTSASAVNSS